MARPAVSPAGTSAPAAASVAAGRRFRFGRNWKQYVRHALNDAAARDARASLLRFLPAHAYAGGRFIDVGCGSGLFSLAALLLGCREAYSFDADDESVEAARLLRAKFRARLPAEARWTIERGDVLDDGLVARLAGAGDVVYSWGVVHHTGAMWTAIRNAGSLVAPGRHLVLAVYNHAPSSDFWLGVKRFYNEHPLAQPVLGPLYGLFCTASYAVKNRTLNLYRQRGMHVFTDALDWIGGYPYEYACFDEVREFVERLGFQLATAPTRLPCGRGEPVSAYGRLRTANTGCNEFVFRRAC